ncbi:MAG: hypothetical protein L3J36_08530 [Rhodobacteraceae bacterium]|nr:hypothetical protein [Paracoccaceae bacterium]
MTNISVSILDAGALLYLHQPGQPDLRFHAIWLGGNHCMRMLRARLEAN